MKNRRLIQLDILRGVAILLVLGRHPALPVEHSGALHPVAEWWHRFGWTGVDLFFVLSGFLVGGLLCAELRARQTIDVGRFLVRRGFKIWPSYYLFLAAFAAFRLLAHKPGSALDNRDLLASLLNVQNYFGSPRAHTWSLAVEEHFYLVVPLVLYGCARLLTARGGRLTAIPAVPLLSLGLIVFCTALRWHVARGASYSHDRVLFPTHLRMDALFFGVLIAYLYHFHEPVIAWLARHRGWLVASGLALIAPMTVIPVDQSAFVASIGFTMLYVGYGALLVAIVTTPIDGDRAGRWLTGTPARAVAFIGLYSYPIYLWHIDVGIALSRALGRWAATGDTALAARWLCGMTAFVVLSTLMGVLMGRLVERPALALRDRLFPTRAAALPVDSGATPDVPRPHGARPHLPAVTT